MLGLTYIKACLDAKSRDKPAVWHAIGFEGEAKPSDG
jgi:hypothetical protein